MYHDLPIFLSGAFVGASVVFLLWTRDIYKNVRRQKLVDNRLAVVGALIPHANIDEYWMGSGEGAREIDIHEDEEDRPHSDPPPFSERDIARSQANIAAILGPEEVARLEAEDFDDDHCRECDAPRGSCRSCQAEHAADQRDRD